MYKIALFFNVTDGFILIRVNTRILLIFLNLKSHGSTRRYVGKFLF